MGQTTADPLVEFAGRWTTDLAERYLPIEGMPPSRYECLDGNLVLSRRGDTGSSYAGGTLSTLLWVAARHAGFVRYSAINLRFGERRWIVPDLAVLRTPMAQATWVPVGRVLMPVEFASPDRVDGSAPCAEAGVPYFMRVEIAGARVAVELSRLEGERYVPHASAVTGQHLRSELPFPISFDPAELLEPGTLRL